MKELVSNTRIPFELTNEQRRYLGLLPVQDTWNLVCIAGKYLYFDGDIIRKEIQSNEMGNYYETELCEYTTQNRTLLLPKTKRGKLKPLTASALSFRPQGCYFRFDLGCVMIGNNFTRTEYYVERRDNFCSLHEWLDKWMTESTEEDLKDIECFRQAERLHVKYREGDFFTFKVGRRKWGFGRIMMNVDAYRKTEMYARQNNYGLKELMGKPLYIMIYQKLADIPYADLKELEVCAVSHEQPIMDNCFYYGEYKIIGNKPVSPEEWEPVITYGRSLMDRKTVFLQYGLIYKETSDRLFNKFLIGEDGRDNPYCKIGIGWEIYNISDLEKEEKESAECYVFSPLSDPKNKKIKREIFSFFGLDADKTYAEDLKREQEKE